MKKTYCNPTVYFIDMKDKICNGLMTVSDGDPLVDPNLGFGKGTEEGGILGGDVKHQGSYDWIEW